MWIHIIFIQLFKLNDWSISNLIVYLNWISLFIFQSNFKHLNINRQTIIMCLYTEKPVKSNNFYYLLEIYYVKPFKL